MRTPHSTPTPALALAIDPASLRDLVIEIVRATMTELEQSRRAVPGVRLAYSEAEAARLLGLHVHQLRDERLRGRIAASQIVGRRIRYLHDDLINYLMAGRATTGEVRQ